MGRKPSNGEFGGDAHPMSDWGTTFGGHAEPGFVPRPEVAARLRDALSLLEAIEHGELFAGTPNEAGDRRRHAAGLGALAVLQRDLERLLAEVRAYEELVPPLPSEASGRRSASTPRPER